MADSSTEYAKNQTKKTKDLTGTLGKPYPKKKKKKKVEAGSYNKKRRKGYEDMLKEADNY